MVMAVTSSVKTMSGVNIEGVMEYIQKAREKQLFVYTSIHGYLLLLFCVLAGVCYPSVLTFVYFAGSLGSILLLAFGFPIHLISRLFFFFFFN